MQRRRDQHAGHPIIASPRDPTGCARRPRHGAAGRDSLQAAQPGEIGTFAAADARQGHGDEAGGQNAAAGAGGPTKPSPRKSSERMIRSASATPPAAPAGPIGLRLAAQHELADIPASQSRPWFGSRKPASSQIGRPGKRRRRFAARPHCRRCPGWHRDRRHRARERMQPQQPLDHRQRLAALAEDRAHRLVDRAGRGGHERRAAAEVDDGDDLHGWHPCFETRPSGAPQHEVDWRWHQEKYLTWLTSSPPAGTSAAPISRSRRSMPPGAVAVGAAAALHAVARPRASDRERWRRRDRGLLPRRVMA